MMWILVVAANLVSLTFAASALYLAANGKEGWGWFLFCALLAAVCPSKKDEDEA